MPQQILKNLKNKVYKPIYFLSGDEPYYIDLISDFIENNVLDESEKDFNQTILYGKETNMEIVISEAKRYPMMANNNVVIVKEAQHLSKELELLSSYIKNPTPTTLLIFCYKYKKLDTRTKIGKKIKTETVFLTTKQLYDNQIPDWINKYLKTKNYQIQPQASLLMTEFLGTELSKIANAIDKLILNIPEQTLITPELIEKHIGLSKDYNIFELTKALGNKDILKSNRIINYFAKNEKEHPLVMILGGLYNYFTKILIYHYTKDKSRNNIASALKVNPFFVGDYQLAAKNYRIKKLVKIIEYLREYDLKSKGLNIGTPQDSELLKELIFKILH